jgi:hypothetical protein
MQDLERDYGVAGKTHWLLDEELVPRRPLRVARPLPALLRHDVPPETTGERITQRAPSSTDTFSFALGLLASLAIYFILRAADVGGAVQGSRPGEGSAGSVVTATLTAEPEGRLAGAERAALRSLLGRAASSGPSRREDRPAGRSTPVDEQALQPPPTEDPVVPVQPPAPLPVPDPLALLREAPQPREVIEDLERATGLEPATLSLEG